MSRLIFDYSEEALHFGFTHEICVSSLESVIPCQEYLPSRSPAFPGKPITSALLLFNYYRLLELCIMHIQFNESYGQSFHISRLRTKTCNYFSPPVIKPGLPLLSNHVTAHWTRSLSSKREIKSRSKLACGRLAVEGGRLQRAPGRPAVTGRGPRKSPGGDERRSSASFRLAARREWHVPPALRNTVNMRILLAVVSADLTGCWRSESGSKFGIYPKFTKL